MKNWKKILLGFSAVGLMSGTLFAVSAAWFQGMNQAKLSSGQGYTASAYFAGGDGSEATPYIINQPIHLYNLAWLQYLGFFNKTENGAYKQTYFVLGSDVDMSPSSGITWTLPPIGTTDNPFIGNFDGKGYTISNLVVDNALGDGHITHKPSTVDSLAGVNIVGTFGVVGAYNLNSSYTYSSAVNTVKDVELSNVEVKSQLPQTLIGVGMGYVDATISSVGISQGKVTVLAGTGTLDSTLTSNISDYSTIGYCNPAYRNSRKEDSVLVKTQAPITSHFTADETGTANDWGGSIDIKSMYDRLLYFRQNSGGLTKITKAETITTTVVGNVSTTSTEVTSTYGPGFYEYYDSATDTTKLKGSYCFNKYRTDSDTEQYLYLYGKKDFTKTVTTVKKTRTNLTGYWIQYGSYYMVGTKSGNSASISSTTAFASATRWTLPAEGSSGTISATISGSTYYLYGTASYNFWTGVSYSLSLSKNNSTTWTRSNNAFSSSFSYSSWFGSGTATGYLNGGSSWSISGSSQTLAITQAYSETSDTPQTTTQSSGSTYDTYFPLNVGTDSKDPAAYRYPLATNTGYVVSGSDLATNYDTYVGYQGYGDIRVSYYGMGNLANSLNGTVEYNSYYDENVGTASYADNTLQVVTRTASSNGYTRIIDSHNDANNDGSFDVDWTSNNGSGDNAYEDVLPSKVSATATVSSLGLQKYEKSRASLQKVLAGQDNVYGLHFMDTSISKSNYATAEKALIDKVTYTSYQLPRNSIDFRLRKKGYINFFAGTYFPGNTAFFSLHEITRDTNGKISTDSASIKEITQVYGVPSDPTKPFSYAYKNVTYTKPDSTYVLLFDMDWLNAMATSSWCDMAMYYFEIPVNSGEYALGSVAGTTSGGTTTTRDGAYLIYLDLSANAQEIHRTVITEYIVQTIDTFYYPQGIALVTTGSTGETVDPITSAAFALANGFSGTLVMDKTTTSAITVTSSSDSFTTVFKGDSMAIARSGSTDPPTITPASTTIDTLKRLTYVDYNATGGDTTVTVFTQHNNDAMTYTDGTGATITEYIDNDGKTVTIATGSPITDIDITSCNIELLGFYYYYSADTSTITTTFLVGYTSYTTTDKYTYQNITSYTVTLKTTSEALNVNVTLSATGYTITINGTTVATGSLVSVPVTSA